MDYFAEGDFLDPQSPTSPTKSNSRRVASGAVVSGRSYTAGGDRGGDGWEKPSKQKSSKRRRRDSSSDSSEASSQSSSGSSR